MNSRKAATIGAIAIALPVGLLVLAYAFITSLPTGLPEARERVAADLKRVAERSAPKHLPRPAGSAATQAPTVAATIPKDYYGACDLAMRGFDPNAQPLPPSMLSFDSLVRSLASWEVEWGQDMLAPLPHGGTPQDWLRCIDPAKTAKVGIPRRAGAAPPPLGKISDLNLAEATIYGSNWEIPSFGENWPASEGSGAQVLATAAQVVLLRAAGRGEADKVERYLPRCLELSLRAETDSFGGNAGRYYGGDLGLTTTLALVGTQVDLPEEVWARAAARIAEEHLTDEELAAYHKAFLLRQAEMLRRRVTKLPREQNTLHYFWQGRVQEAVVVAMAPVVRGRVDAYVAALLAEGPQQRNEQYRLLEQLRVTQKASDIAVDLEDYFRTENELIQLPQVIREEFPDFILPTRHPNWRTDWAAATVAAIRFRLLHGREPATFDELMPDLLPADFPKASHAGWYLVFSEGSLRILRLAPSDGFGTVSYPSVVYPQYDSPDPALPTPTPTTVAVETELRLVGSWISLNGSAEEEAALRRGPLTMVGTVFFFPAAEDKARIGEILAGT